LTDYYDWVLDLKVEEVDKPIEEWIFIENNVPLEFQSILSEMAYERGHSAGDKIESDINELNNLAHVSSRLKDGITVTYDALEESMPYEEFGPDFVLLINYLLINFKNCDEFLFHSWLLIT